MAGPLPGGGCSATSLPTQTRRAGFPRRTRCSGARRATPRQRESIPSAGYSQGFAFVVLTDPGQRRLFWETTSGPEWRGESESESLIRAPVVILPLAHKQAYLDRYVMPDKAHTPLSREDRGLRRTGTSIRASVSC